MRKFNDFWIEILRKIGCVRKVPNANKPNKNQWFFDDFMVRTVQKSIRKTLKKHEKKCRKSDAKNIGKSLKKSSKIDAKTIKEP